LHRLVPAVESRPFFRGPARARARRPSPAVPSTPSRGRPPHPRRSPSGRALPPFTNVSIHPSTSDCLSHARDTRPRASSRPGSVQAAAPPSALLTTAGSLVPSHPSLDSGAVSCPVQEGNHLNGTTQSRKAVAGNPRPRAPARSTKNARESPGGTAVARTLDLVEKDNGVLEALFEKLRDQMEKSKEGVDQADED
jgi:hypothetical protein